MATKKQELVIPWPFAPQKVGLNDDTQLLKLIAMIAMIIDHSGKMMFPKYPVMRIIGRLAFPIYAYCIAAGSVYTRDPLRYLKRVVLTALISQPIYAVAMAHTSNAMYAVSFVDNPLRAAIHFYVESWWYPGILFTLALGIVLIWTIRQKQFVLMIAMFLLCWRMQGKIDYGFRGLMLIVLFYLFCEHRWVSLPIMLAYLVWWGLQGSAYQLFGVKFGIQMFAVFALIPIYMHTHSGIRLPKWVFYAYYPAHLALIYALNHYALI